jgi:uncharacterized membrane protein
MKKIDLVCIIILIFFIFLSSKALFHKGFFRTVDDISVVRIVYMEKELLRNNWFNNFPVRLSGELSNNYSYPLYLFYAPLTYYIGSVLMLLFSLSHIVATKYVYAFPLLFGPLAFYFALRQKMRPFPSLIAAIFFALFPYRGFNTYTRGAVAEAWAISFIPLAFAGTFLLEKKKLVGSLVFAVSFFLILISHNIVGFSFLGFILLYGLLFFRKNRNFWKYFLLGLGMSAFFLIPMLYYLKIIRVTYLDVNNTYIFSSLVPIDKIFNVDLFKRALIGEDLLIGSSGILFSVIMGGLTFYGYKIFKHKRIDVEKYFWVISALVLFLLLFKSFEFVWRLTMPVTGIFQFTWRLLSLLSFIIPYVLGMWLNDLKNIFLKVVICIAVVASCVNFLANFKPSEYSYFYEYKPEGLCATTSNQDEYLPVWVKGCPSERAPLELSTKGDIRISEDRSLLIKADVASDQKSELVVNKFYFPGWHVFVDGKDSLLDYHFSSDGLFKTSLSPGVHKIEVVYKKTGMMWLSDLISVISFILLFFYLFQIIRAIRIKKRLSNLHKKE